MKFETSLHLWSGLTLLSGAAALLASGLLHAGLLVAFLLALVLSLIFPLRIQPKFQGIWFGAFLILFVLDGVYVSDYVTASTHLMLVVGLLKIWAGRSDRDYLLVLSSSFTLLLVAASGPVSSAFLAVLAAFVFFSILSLLHFESRRAYAAHPQATFRFTSYLGVSFLITLMVALVAVPVFLSVPRSRLDLWSAHRGASPLISGFSEHVTLGDIGRILNSHRVFMRIKLSRPSAQIPVDLKWKGVILDHYGGRSWSSTPRAPRRIARSPLRQGFLVSGPRRRNENLLTQIITQEAANQTIFGADQMVWVAGLGESERFIRTDHNGSLFFSRTRPRSFSYRVDSDLVHRSERLARFERDPLPEEVRRRTLQLPWIDPRITELTARVTRAHAGESARAFALERFLKENYSYSLENRSAASADPLAHFLLEGGAGHCEYYATALAVMLRIEGIPSRVVNGFRRGAVNLWSEELIVRQSDAHSWVEAWLAGTGWVELDATPMPVRYDDGAFLLATQFGDALELFWNQLLSFDRISQLSLVVAALQKVRSALEGLRQVPVSLRAHSKSVLATLAASRFEVVVLLLALLLLALLSLPLISRLRRRLGEMRAAGTVRLGSGSCVFLRRLERLLRSRGLTRLPPETPLEFARRAGGKLHSPVPLEITGLYYQARFGGYPLTPSDLRKIEDGLARLR